MQRALLELVLLGRRRRRARLLDRPLRALVQRRVARPRALPRARAGRAARRCRSLARRRGRGARGRGVAIALAGRVAGDRPRHAVAVVITTLFGLGVAARALAGLAARASTGSCSATCSASRDGDLVAGGCARRSVAVVALRRAPPAAARGRLRPRQRARALGAQAAARRPGAARAARGRDRDRASRASGTCWCVAVLVGAGGDRAPARPAAARR